MGLLQRIKNAVFVRKIYYWLISVIAGVNHRHEKRRKRNDQLIRVVFICQYVPSWNKISPTYHRLEEDDRFAVSILCVPESISSKENKTYLFFLSHGYNGVLNAWNNGRWISLKEFDADYFFFYRPYDNYLPWPYKSFIACRYGKICMIPYGTSMSRDLMESAFKYPFMSNVAILFADSMAEVEYNSAHNKRFSDQRFLYCGIPALESVLLEKNSSAPSWEWSRNSFRIMWTPRWSLNQKGGGSNYFKYYHRYIL